MGLRIKNHTEKIGRIRFKDKGQVGADAALILAGHWLRGRVVGNGAF